MPPDNVMYNMSKAALKCYTEGLEHELLMKRRSSESCCWVRAVLLVPGWVNSNILLKAEREKARAANDGESFAPQDVFFYEERPHPGAWMPQQVIKFMQHEMDQGKFYIICPDNEVDRTTDNVRMTWTMQDITEDRPPLSRWHPDHQETFAAYLKEQREKEQSF